METKTINTLAIALVFAAVLTLAIAVTIIQQEQRASAQIVIPPRPDRPDRNIPDRPDRPNRDIPDRG